MGFLAIIYLAFLSATAIATPQLPTLACTIIKSDFSTCHLIDVILLQDQSEYTVRATSVPNVATVNVTDSKLAVISSAFCDTLFALRTFIAINQGIETINQNAFESCFQIRHISLPFNKIQVIHPRLFWNNFQLSMLDLAGNKLMGISEEQFWRNTKIEKLHLHQNFLRALPASAVQNCGELQSLMLDSNEITSLDSEKLGTFLPTLKVLTINMNNFACDKLSGYLQFFASKNVELLKNKTPRNKDYPMIEVDGFSCVSVK